MSGGPEQLLRATVWGLAADPHERHNLVVDPDHVRARLELRRRLMALIEEAEGLRPEIVSWDEPDLAPGTAPGRSRLESRLPDRRRCERRWAERTAQGADGLDRSSERG